jgi:hypothetical protein
MVTDEQFRALQDMLRLGINVQSIIAVDPAAGPMWMVSLGISNASGIAVTLTMTPQNARAIANEIRKIALEAETKIIPAAAPQIRI